MGRGRREKVFKGRGTWGEEIRGQRISGDRTRGDRTRNDRTRSDRTRGERTRRGRNRGVREDEGVGDDKGRGRTREGGGQGEEVWDNVTWGDKVGTVGGEGGLGRECRMHPRREND